MLVLEIWLLMKIHIQRLQMLFKKIKSRLIILFKKYILTSLKIICGQSNNNYFEGKVNALLNNTIKQTGNVGLENLDQKNRVTNMVNSGSKGKPTNVAQIVACLGQQNVDGKRIPYGYNDRTLPHYSKYDDSSEARGFVENSIYIWSNTSRIFLSRYGWQRRSY